MKDPKGRTTIGFEKHIFVCENSREDGHPRGCCKGKGGCEIRILFKKEILIQKTLGFLGLVWEDLWPLWFIT